MLMAGGMHGFFSFVSVSSFLEGVHIQKELVQWWQRAIHDHLKYCGGRNGH
jgi:hypothetical protein